MLRRSTPSRRKQFCSYPCQKVILHYLPIGMRRKLAQRVPDAKKMNRMIGYRLKNVRIAIKMGSGEHLYRLRFDTLRWLYRVDPTKEDVAVRLPDGRAISVKKDGCVFRLNQTILDRAGTVVRRLEFVDYNDIAPFAQFAPAKIGLLRLKIVKSSYKKGFLTAFASSEIDTLEIDDTRGDTVAFRDLNHVNFKKLRVWTEVITNGALARVKAKQFDFYVNLASCEIFERFCEKLKGANIGSAFTANWYLLHTELTAFYAKLEAEMGAERRFLNGRECLSIQLPDKEINIYHERRVHYGASGRYQFTARAMEKGSSRESPNPVRRAVERGFHCSIWSICWLLSWLMSSTLYSHPALHLRYFIFAFFFVRFFEMPITLLNLVHSVFFTAAFWAVWTLIVQLILVKFHSGLLLLARRNPLIWSRCAIFTLNVICLTFLIPLWLFLSYVVWMLTYLVLTQTFYPF